MSNLHLWQGRSIDDHQLDELIKDFSNITAEVLATPLKTEVVVKACADLSYKLISKDETYSRLHSLLMQDHELSHEEASAALSETAEFLAMSNIERKMQRELGSVTPLVATRASFKDTLFEQWAPLGLMIHLAPANAVTTGALSVVEGLLTGNINVLKISSKDGPFALALLDELGQLDASGALARHIITVRLSSQDPRLALLMSTCDGVAAWGSEEATQGAKNLTPAGARFIEWGPKISFTYASVGAAQSPDFFSRLAYDMIETEQQACSSPQVAYVDTEDRLVLEDFSRKLGEALDAASKQKTPPKLGPAEQAEITNVVQLTRMESHLGLTDVKTAKDDTWRVLIDYRPGLRASPLNRTIWVKGLPRSQIVKTLRPMRRYLQTAGLEVEMANVAAISSSFIAAGCLRITPIGSMLASYSGEPHDGVYALSRYARRISIRQESKFKNIASFAQLAEPLSSVASSKSILTKSESEKRVVAESMSELYFKSGGSSGSPKLSIFTYDDYHAQMRLAAHGVLAAGLDPARDLSMNLFFAGGLYGGFISFFTVLESLSARQLPMAAHSDLDEVCETIIAQRVNVLFGMPSYLLALFEKHGEKLARYGGIEKLFYGGEHLTESQQRHLREKFGIKLIKSATYGSVDAGPLGYQCSHCEGSVHHLHTELQTLEILQTEDDKPVDQGEVGRLIFTSHIRHGQDLSRYEIGDLGRWVAQPCPCGIKAPRFELMGRHGDIFRIGSQFFNYRKFVRTLETELNYSGEVQIHLSLLDGKREQLKMLVSAPAAKPEAIRQIILNSDKDLHEVVETLDLIDLEAVAVDAKDLVRSSGSGKLRAIVDYRIS